MTYSSFKTTDLVHDLEMNAWTHWTWTYSANWF